MTHELILTSVAQGLESESGGFCVVAADRQFPESLIENLFQISDYRYHIQSDSDDTNQNSVIYSHSIIKLASTSAQSSASFPILPPLNKKQNSNTSSISVWHVLSRIAPSGKDYRDKLNRLAHHIILTEDEFVVEGPAWLLALAGFHFTQWYTPPINFPFGRPIPTISFYGIPPQTCRQKIARERLSLDPRKMSLYPYKSISTETIRKSIQANEEQIASADFPTSPCPTWQETAGDAGWGGILAESARNKKEAVIIYPQGMNLLPLFVEALAIVPAQFIWNTTFTTYYVDPDNNNIDANKPETNKNFRRQQKNYLNAQMMNVPYLWKGVVAGSPEAEKFDGRGDILVIDLTRKPVEVPEGIFVKFAITGDENDLPIETQYPQNQNANNPNNETAINDPITPQDIYAETATVDVLPTDINQNFDPAINYADTKTIGQHDLANLKFEPNTEPATLSAQPTSESATHSGQTHLPPPIPNIITTNNSTKTQNKITLLQQNTTKILNQLVRILSKNQFYLIYAIVLMIIVSLLFLVLDQIMGFGAMQSLFGQKKHVIDDDIKHVVTTPTDAAEIKKTNVQDEPKTVEQIRAEQQKKLEETLIAINKKRKTDAIELDRYIREFNFPPFLPFKLPTIKEGTITVPKNYSIFTGLAGLHRYGSALKLEWVSLWDFDEKKIETRRLKFNIGDPQDQDNESDLEQENNNENKDEKDNPPSDESDKLSRYKTVNFYNKSGFSNNGKKQLRYRAVNLNDVDNPVAVNDEILFPDTNRFEWEVVAVIQNKKAKNNNNGKNNDDKDNNTDENENKITEVKLFHIKLKENGLHIKWERSGLVQAHFYDTLRVALGFLRFTVERFADNDGDVKTEVNADEHVILLDENISNVNSKLHPDQFEYFVQLFEPQLVSPISPSIVFSETTTKFSVPTPLAVMPWESLFDSSQFMYKLDLDVKVQPKVITDILTDVKKTGQSQPVEIEFTTKKIEAKRKKPDRAVISAEEYFPLAVKFVAEADTANVIWTDSLSAELEILKKKLEETKLESKRVEVELNKIQQQFWNLGNAVDKAEERKKLENRKGDLENNKRELSNYDFEVNSRIKNLPDSHKVVMSNKDIQFDYSVYLTSGENKRELLIMSTSNKLVNERINKK
ncbi:MAG: hypothetical protein LBC74_07565 [Planctomycetaceae bacterium]|jgi:hypothetical protein|nr:hypothetical protein [Planctomycetaceae bacterium]